MNQQYAPRQRSSSAAAPAAAGAASEACEEENFDFVDPLYEAEESMNGGGNGADDSKAELPYSTLWQMQLDREDQSHQEACEKYGKVRILRRTTGEEIRKRSVWTRRVRMVYSCSVL